MASSSEIASTSCPPSAHSAPTVNYDVFLSFRGPDSRRSIVASIFHELQNRGIKTFMDDSDTGLETGKPISPSLLKAIKESRSAIVVLSPNYASSTWCLHELTSIVQRMEEKDMIVLPIFYYVDPSDVRYQRGSFTEALSRHEERFGLDVVNGWKDALTKVANLSGLESSKYRSDRELVSNIVETMCGKLRPIDFNWAMCNEEFVEFEATTQAANKIMTALQDYEVTTIGVFGMPGVGKSAMVRHLTAQARELGLFRHVILGVVSQTPNLRNIQGTLADLLGLKLREETDAGRAARLIQTISRGHKILIVLDDIWKTIDLSSIGIPNQRELQKCNSKVLLTTRRANVCHSMSCQESIPLPVLSEADAWKLFVFKARKSFDESIEFHDTARRVAKECAGLPVALIAVARALGNKDLDDWKEAARRLKAARPANYEDDREVFKCIKLSYDYLRPDDNNIAKSFFLLCCLFPEDFDIPVEDLVVYAIGKGIFHDAFTIQEARANAGLVVKYLKDSSLLLDGAYEGSVKMHDVIRDVAISISLSEDGPRFLVKAGCALKDWPAINIAHEGYSAVSLMRNEIHELPTQLVCSELQILLLQSNNIYEVPNPFFQSANKLRVLDLRETSISFLPSSLSLLTNLQALYLDECKRMVGVSALGKLTNLQILSMKNFGILGTRGTRQISLPKEIGCLTNLKMLDVTDACFQTVPSEVISRLKALEELYMKCNFSDWGSERGIGRVFFLRFGSNASFEELTSLSRLNSLRVHISDVKCLPQQVSFKPNWENFDICISQKTFLKQSYYQQFFERKLTVKLDVHRHHFQHLILNTSMRCLPKWFIEAAAEKAEILQYIGYKGLQNIVTEHDHGKLHVLKRLAVIECKMYGGLMKSITSGGRPVFESLEELYLEGVHGLKSLCDGELPPRSLSNLKLLNVRNCRDLSYGLLHPNLLSRLHNLEILHCEYAEAQRENLGVGDMLHYVFAFVSIFDEAQLKDNVLQKLREITLCYLVNLVSLCLSPGLPSGAFGNLKSLAIRGCHNMRYLFDDHVGRSLLQLELLWVEDCSLLETLLTQDKSSNDSSVISFPKLKEIYLNSLPELTGIYGRESVRCPSLEHLYVHGCPKLSDRTVSDFGSKNQVKTNDEGHFATIFERLFHRQFNAEEFPQFFSKKRSDFSIAS